MNYYVNEILSYLVGISAIIGLIRFRKIDRSWDPFIFMLWLGLIAEIVSTLCINYAGTNVVPSNLYSLSEAILILFFFYNMELFGEKKKKILISLLILYMIAWVTVISIFSFYMFSSYFNILYSFITVLMSIQMINKLILFEKGYLLKNSLFLVCISFIAFFTLAVIMEIFWFYGFTNNSRLDSMVHKIQEYINIIVNIIYVFVVLWIPKKLNYTLQ